MRAREFINETTPTGKIPKRLSDVSQGMSRIRDVGGYDRAYHLNRISMAAAMADGRSHKPVEMDSASFVEKYNVIFPYTDMEHMMMMQAMATVPTDGNELVKRSKSQESSDTNTVSPMPSRDKLRK